MKRLFPASLSARILACGFFLLSMASIAEAGLPISIEVYPETAYAGMHHRICLDIGFDQEGSDIVAMHLDASPLTEDAEVFPYKNARGQKRYCCSIKLKPDTPPGTYRLPLEVTLKNGDRIRTYAEVRVAQKAVIEGPDILSQVSRNMLETLAGSPAVPGNRVKMLEGGLLTFKHWMDTLKSARTYIHLQTYYLDDDGMCSELVDILKEKAAQGVDVDLIITRYSQLGKSPITYLDLKGHGITILMIGDIGFPKSSTSRQEPWHAKMRDEYRIFNTLPRETAFQQWFKNHGEGDLMVDYAIHEKMLIVDGEKAIVGGRNISDCYFFWWKDLDLALDGPIVGEIEAAFQTNWSEFGGQPLSFQTAAPQSPPDGVTANLTHSKPWLGDYRNLDVLCSAIGMAKERVYITSQYLALPPKLMKALADAARKGVDVRILTNSFETGQEVNFALCHFISLNYYRDLLKAGVHIHEYTCPPERKLRPYYHAKQFIIDGKWFSTGSFNLSMRSAYLESEIMVNVLDRDMATEREQAFLSEISQNTREISLSDLARQEDRYSLLMDVARHLEILY